MAIPRRHLDPEHMRRIAAEIYGGSARTDPRFATWLLHTHSRVGPRRGYYYQLLASAGWTSIPFLHSLRQPTLVLTGDDDPLIPPINGRLLATLMPNARLHVYRGGHLALAADPGLLVPVIEEFLHDPPAASGPVSEEENTT
jgi:pimeloyl-ACP methyl ester carboxylesterase